MTAISVLMPVFNVEPYVDLAVGSILNQTFGDFEFLIVDDASSDGTWSRLEMLAKLDNRIRLWRNETNEGLASAVNRLVPFAAGKYLARMDGDDIALPDRFARQLEILQSDVADICGGWVVNFGDEEYGILCFPEMDAAIRVSLLFDWSLLHPTIMMRREVLETTPYRTGTAPATDYDFFVRAARSFRFYNLPEILLFRRMHRSQVTKRQSEKRDAAKMAACRLALEDMGIQASDRELRLHARVYDSAVPESWDEVLQTANWMRRLDSAMGSLPSAMDVLTRNWYHYCLRCAHFGPRVYRLLSSRARTVSQVPFGRRLIILALSLLRMRYHSRTYRLMFRTWRGGAKMRRQLRHAEAKREQLIRSLADGSIEGSGQRWGGPKIAGL